MPEATVGRGAGRCGSRMGRPGGSTAFVADATGLSRSYVQKLISDGRLTADGDAAQGQRDRHAPGRRSASTSPSRPPSTSRPAPDIPLAVVYEDDDLLIVDKPAGPRRPPVARAPRRRHAGQRAARPGRRRRLRRDRRRRAAGHRPPPRPRHERPADGRQARRRAGLADGPAQGAPRPEDLPRARRRDRRGGGRPDRGADRPRPEAPDADGRRPRRARVDDRLPGPRAVRRLDAARARPRDRPDPPDPRPPRRHRPPGRRRPGVRHGHVATRAGRPGPAVPARLAAGAGVAVRRPPHPGHGAAARRAGAGLAGRCCASRETAR